MTENEAKACAMLAEAAYLTGYMAANATTTPINKTECSLSEMLLNVHYTIKQAIEQLGKPAESEIDWAKTATNLRGQQP